MEKYNISAKQIIQRTISGNDEANPFSDSFNLKRLNELLTLDLEYYSKTYNIIEKKSCTEIIEIIIQLNSFYEELMFQIETLIIEINLDEITLIEEILAISNFEYQNLVSEQKKEILANNSTHFDLFRGSKIKNVFGESIGIQDALDINTDVCNELINLILSIKIKPDIQEGKIPEEELISLVRKLMITTNLLVNIKTAVEFYRKEFGDLEKSNNTIKFKNNPVAYSAIKSVGKQRGDNLIYESSLYASTIPKKTIKLPHTTIEKGKIYVTLNDNGKEHKHSDLHLSVLSAFYFHLHLKPLKFATTITITEVFDFIVALRHFFVSIEGESIIENAVRTQNRDAIPIKVEVIGLIKYLVSATSLNRKTIEVLLNTVSQTLHDEIQFWKKPLIRINGSYYFLFTPIAQGHLTYQVDNIINNVISLDKQSRFFSKLLEMELNHDISENYKLKKVDATIINKLGVKSNTVLVYETISTLIIIESCVFNYCIDSNDYATGLNELGKAATEVNEVCRLINGNINKLTDLKIESIIGIVATNHTSLSGLNIEGVFVLDSYLIKNYMKVGKFKKGMVISEGGKNSSQEVSYLKYYNSEKEFASNFRSFCLDPLPIVETRKLMKAKEFSIVHNEMVPQIMRDGYEFISLESSIWFLVNEAEYYLKQLFYFEESANETFVKKKMQEQLNYILPQIFSFIAIDSSDRSNRIDVVNIFKRTGTVGRSQLIFAYNNLVNELVKKRVEDDTKTDNMYNVDHEVARKHFYQLLDSKKFSKLSLANPEFAHNLTIEEIENLIEYLLELLSNLELKYCSEQELVNNYLFLSVFINLSKSKKKYEKYITAGCLNFVDLLNYNYNYQKARDVCEEILDFSFKNERPPLLGWNCLFRCYIKQNNIFDASYYGCLYISSLSASSNLSKYQIIDSLYSSMLFFRDFGFVEVAENIYAALKPLKLEDYDLHKFTLSHFNSKLMNSINAIDDTINEAKNFLNKNIDSIIKYGQKGALPWWVFICNLKALQSKQIIKDISQFDVFFQRLSKEIDKKTMESLESIFFPVDVTTKAIFHDTLAKVFETRYIDDFTSELNKLELLAKSVASLSINPLDIDNLLLAGIVLNDNTLTFISKEPNPEGAAFVSVEYIENLSKLRTYSTEIISKLNLKHGQLFCWIFQVFNNVYALTISAEKKIQINRLTGWKMQEMDSWLNNISKFYFDDKGDFSINIQEQEYCKLLSELSFARLDFNEPFEELLISTSLSIASFPHNLLQCSNNIQRNIGFHEELIKELIQKSGYDFLAFHLPIANVVSLEWYIKNGLDCEMKVSELTLEAWIPIVDEDIVIAMSHERLKPVIEKYNGKIYENVLPDKPLSSNINVFLAHGGKGTEGFRTIYTKHSEGHAIIKKWY
ncbi:MAG: hypothetical protein IPP32_14555 [Bacteroidetes bacterium]|nr:hypothetical protein [Bacteroidota bacterium]